MEFGSASGNNFKDAYTDPRMKRLACFCFESQMWDQNGSHQLFCKHLHPNIKSKFDFGVRGNEMHESIPYQF